jgi:MoaA/NifB/PqqE/SkfB family radical SAM enzyme
MLKMNEKTKRILFWSKGIPRPPVTIELVPTNRCNFNCSSCWRQDCTKEELKKKFSDEMSDERLLKLIDEAASLGVKDIGFVGGGEPLARPITFELIKKIKKYGMEVDLVTNGSLLTDEMMDSFVRIKVDRLKFSVDGSCAELQDKLRGTKCYNKIIKNIKKLSDLKIKYKSKKPKLSINTVISTENYKDLPNIVTLASKVGINEILLLPLVVFSKEGEKLKMSQKEAIEFQEIIKKCSSILKKHHISSNMNKFTDDVKYLSDSNKMDRLMLRESESFILEEKKKNGEKLAFNSKINSAENFKSLPCYEPWVHITILPNGNIAPCFNNYIWETKITVKNHNLKQLWYGDYFEKFRKEISSRKVPKACSTCCIWRLFESQDKRKEIDEWKIIKKEELSSIKNKLFHAEEQVKILNSTNNNQRKKHNKLVLDYEERLNEIFESKGYRYLLKPMDDVSKLFYPRKKINKKWKK